MIEHVNKNSLIFRWMCSKVYWDTAEFSIGVVSPDQHWGQVLMRSHSRRCLMHLSQVQRAAASHRQQLPSGRLSPLIQIFWQQCHSCWRIQKGISEASTFTESHLVNLVKSQSWLGRRNSCLQSPIFLEDKKISTWEFKTTSCPVQSNSLPFQPLLHIKLWHHIILSYMFVLHVLLFFVKGDF